MGTPVTSRTDRWYWKLYNVVVVVAAMLWRRLLFRVRVIAISGSLGKTTAKECLVGILAPRFPIVGTVGSSNGRKGIPRLLLRARPRHRYIVAEVGIQGRGHMRRSALLLRPDVVLITSVARQHSVRLGDLDAIAREKAKLLGPLPSDGLAVLNKDDPRVADMAASRQCRVCYFGTSSSADYRATDVAGDWPARLAFTVHSGDESHRIQTHLVGTHWVPSVMAALATAAQCGVPLGESAEALANVSPFPARLDPEELPCGATILRDEYNGTMDTYRTAIEVMRRARARRRLAVFGRVHDHPDGLGAGIRAAARELVLAGAADVAVFVGAEAEEAQNSAVSAGMNSERIHCFPDAKAAAQFLRHELRDGDLMLLKGTWDDHLSRIYFALRGEVGCWVSDCRLRGMCDDCHRLKFQPRVP